MPPRSRNSHTDSTDGMLVTRGRGYRPRVGPPLGHPGPGSRQTEQDEEEYVAAVSGRGPRTASAKPGRRESAGWMDDSGSPVARLVAH